LQFLLSIYISDNRFLHLVTVNSIIEYVTIVPILLIHLEVVKRTPLLNLTRALRLLMVYRMDTLMARYSEESSRNLFRLLYTLIANMIISSAALYFFERELAPNDSLNKKSVRLPFTQTYFDWIYFMLVTLTVLGFGDVYPVTIYGQVPTP
jgi:voltage-gated potassium channel